MYTYSTGDVPVPLNDAVSISVTGVETERSTRFPRETSSCLIPNISNFALTTSIRALREGKEVQKTLTYTVCDFRENVWEFLCLILTMVLIQMELGVQALTKSRHSSMSEHS